MSESELAKSFDPAAIEAHSTPMNENRATPAAMLMPS